MHSPQTADASERSAVTVYTHVMQFAERTACAKIILCGEHAVVYGRPAIALPLPHLRAHARMTAQEGSLTIHATDLGEAVVVAEAEASHPLYPLAAIARLTCEMLSVPMPSAHIDLHSDIPIGANLGSGAAVSIAIVRTIAAWAERELSAADASTLAFEVEKMHHGTPSGIDNTTIAWERPVRFIRGAQPQILSGEYIEKLPLIIAGTGKTTPTHIPVGDVRSAWLADTARIERIFDDIAACVLEAQHALGSGDLHRLGAALNENHRLLQSLDVSSPELDALCAVARNAGALGAKMSGGGRGGNMLCIARDAEHARALEKVLLAASQNLRKRHDQAE